ncbi:mediator of RNA polymerase II transcription subunit 25 isoform X10 [Manis pentadactyla]|uniref:mediator of RNA polymerase II transcription subunit 25 isoform X10 n=2 Tax=Manis pentadactyla TaxID=143292 RepID=UPI00255C3873|nr:mediator of RNA polymerase II transcription subunit 25 isoform X10 [Manis pentadactyla]
MVVLRPRQTSGETMGGPSTASWCSTRWTALLSPTYNVTPPPAAPMSLSPGSMALSSWAAVARAAASSLKASAQPCSSSMTSRRCGSRSVRRTESASLSVTRPRTCCPLSRAPRILAARPRASYRRSGSWGWLSPRHPPAKAARTPASSSTLGCHALRSPPAASAPCPPAVPGSRVECSPGGCPECCGGRQEPEGWAGPTLLAHQPSPASCSRSGSPLQPGTSTPTASRAPWRPQATPCFPAQPGLHGGLWPRPGTPCAAWRAVHGRHGGPRQREWPFSSPARGPGPRRAAVSLQQNPGLERGPRVAGEAQTRLRGCQHQADAVAALPGLRESRREPEDGAVAAEADHAAHPAAAADHSGPFVPELEDGPVPFHQQGPGVPQGPLPHHGQRLRGLRALPPHGALRGARAHAPVLVQEEDLHGPHPLRPERLRQRHPAGHHQPQASPAAEAGAAARDGGTAGASWTGPHSGGPGKTLAESAPAPPTTAPAAGHCGGLGGRWAAPAPRCCPGPPRGPPRPSWSGPRPPTSWTHPSAPEPWGQPPTAEPPPQPTAAPDWGAPTPGLPPPPPATRGSCTAAPTAPGPGAAPAGAPPPAATACPVLARAASPEGSTSRSDAAERGSPGPGPPAGPAAQRHGGRHPHGPHLNPRHPIKFLLTHAPTPVTDIPQDWAGGDLGGYLCPCSGFSRRP